MYHTSTRLLVSVSAVVAISFFSCDSSVDPAIENNPPSILIHTVKVWDNPIGEIVSVFDDRDTVFTIAWVDHNGDTLAHGTSPGLPVGKSLWRIVATDQEGATSVIDTTFEVFPSTIPGTTEPFRLTNNHVNPNGVLSPCSTSLEQFKIDLSITQDSILLNFLSFCIDLGGITDWDCLHKVKYYETSESAILTPLHDGIISPFELIVALPESHNTICYLDPWIRPYDYCTVRTDLIVTAELGYEQRIPVCSVLISYKEFTTCYYNSEGPYFEHGEDRSFSHHSYVLQLE